MKNAKQSLLSRRMFLKGTAGVTMSIPFLSSLFETAVAADGTPLRFIGMRLPNAPKSLLWYPTVAGSKPTLNVSSFNPAYNYKIVQPTNLIAENVRTLSLSSLQGPLSPILNTEWDALRSKMNLLRGFDYLGVRGGNHSSGVSFAAHWAGIDQGTDFKIPNSSVDQILAHSSAFNGGAPKEAFVLSPGGEGSSTCSYYGVPGSNNYGIVPSQSSAQQIFNTYFKNLNTTGSTAEDAQKALAARESKLAIDHVYEDYRRILRNSRISKEDKINFESHVAFVTDLEKSLAASGNLSLLACTKPSVMDTQDPNVFLDQYINVAVAALQCDLTRTVAWCFGGTDFNYIKWVNDGIEHDGGSHQNDPNWMDLEVKYHRFWCNAAARFMKKLDQIVEPNGKTMLDNSLTLVTSEFGGGMVTHQYQDMAVLLVGSAGGKIKTGQFIDYRRLDLAPWQDDYGTNLDKVYTGRLYNEVVISVMQWMGLSPAEYELAGQPGFGTYTDLGRGQDHFSRYNFGDKRSIIPGLSTT